MSVRWLFSVSLLALLVAAAAAILDGVVLGAEPVPAHGTPRGLAGSPVVPGVVLMRPRAGVTAAEVVPHGVRADKTRGAPFWRARVAAGQETAEARRLARDPRVEYAEPDYVRELQAEPNDPCYPLQWHLPKIRAPQAWGISRGAGIVAVLDTGVDLSHPDLQGKLVAGYDFVNDDDEPSDDHWHGTYVAGIVAAAADNGAHAAGVTWLARVMPLKVVGSEGRGSDSSISQAIRYAVDHGASVINLSLGGPQPSQTLKEAVDYAWSRGRVVVAAAGNGGQDGNAPMYPAAYEHVVAVGATDASDQHAPYSQTGSYVSVAAPGGYIPPGRESDPDPTLRITSIVPPVHGKYEVCSGAQGTSTATPQAAGLAALLWGANAALSNQDVRDIMERSAVDLGDPGRDDVFGWGRIDAASALDLATAPSIWTDRETIHLLADRATSSAPLQMAIRNDGYGYLNWMAVADSSSSWLRVNGGTTAAGVAPTRGALDRVEVTIDPAGLAPGRSYDGQIVLSAPGTEPRTVRVTLHYAHQLSRLFAPVLGR